MRAGADLHYVEWEPADRPSIAPPIVLLHGLGSNARFWDRVARHLSTRHLVALDQRAHGLTGTRSGMSFAMTDMLADIAWLVIQLGLDRPVVVGHSWGASVALEFVANHPDLASGLVFVDGPLMGLGQIFSWEEVEATMQPPLPRYSAWREAVADAKKQLSETWGEDLQAFVEAGLTGDGDALVPAITAVARHAILRELYGSSPAGLWPAVKVPAIVLPAGRKQSRIVQAMNDGLARLQAVAPAVMTIRLDTPHDIPLYAPAEVAREIERIARMSEVVRA